MVKFVYGGELERFVAELWDTKYEVTVNFFFDMIIAWEEFDKI